jgi:multidrug transporter EmrE-like cation transporter
MSSPHSLPAFLALGMVSSVLFALGLLMMKSRGAALPPVRLGGALRAGFRWIRDPIWLGGLCVQIVGYALYVVVLANAPVSLVAVMMQGGIALFVLFAVTFLGERARPREWIGIGGIIAAMVLLGLSLEPAAAGSGIRPAALLILSAGAIVAAIAPAAVAQLRRSGAALALASGIAFGLGSLYAKALTDVFLAQTGTALLARAFANPWIYLAIAANLTGLVLLQNSFHWARGIVVMPLSSACSNAVPIVGGMIAFGEHLPSDPFAAATRIGAFALTIGAGALIAAVPCCPPAPCSDPEQREHAVKKATLV